MDKLYRHWGNCYNYHNWISSPTTSEKSPQQTCPICGVETFYQRDELILSVNFVIEPAQCIGLNGKITQERRYYLAISDQLGKTIARCNMDKPWDDVIYELNKIKDLSHEVLLKIINNEGWTIY